MSKAVTLVRDDAGGSLVHYEPAEGLKAMAVAEAAEKHFRRAKDAEGLFAAVSAKLTEQRKFVLWYDQQKTHGGDRRSPEFQDNGSVILKPAAFAVDAMTLSRWRTRLKEQHKFDETLEKAQEQCLKVCEAKQGTSECARATNTGEEDWHTPPRLIEAAREVLGEIDLDPASSLVAQRHVNSKRFFTRDEDGLAQPWHGRVWLNPPYAGAQVRDFTVKLCEEYEAGNVTAAVLLTNNATDTVWWQRAAKVAAAVCFPLGRVRFLRPSGEEAETPLQGQSVLYFGRAAPAFVATFGAFGLVYRSERRRRAP